MNDRIEQEPDDRTEAVQLAERGAQAWRAVVHAQQSTSPDHADFYGLAGYLVDTLAAIESLAGVLAGQVSRYADGRAHGQVVYDDTRAVDPGVRLHDAALDLRHLADAAAHGRGDTNRFWSAISHIGVEDTPAGDRAEGGVSR